VISERKIRANRANARASTGPKTAHGRSHAARNALRHALSLSVYSDPTLSEEVEALAPKLSGRTLTPNYRNSPAASPKHRSTYVARVTPVINSCPKHWAILIMNLTQCSGRNRHR
jgi:hypothetical protein